VKIADEDLENDENSEPSLDSLQQIGHSVSNDSESRPTLAERSQMSSTFKDVNTPQDLAVLEFCCRKYRQFIDQIENERKNRFKDGVLVQVVFIRHTTPSSASGHYHNVGIEKAFATPIVVRISPRMTVAGFRDLMESRLLRALKPDPAATKAEEGDADGSFNSRKEASINGDEQESLEQDQSDDDLTTKGHADNTTTLSGGRDGSIESNEDYSEITSVKSYPAYDNSSFSIMRRIPLTYERKNTNSYSKPNATNRTLGALTKSTSNNDETACSTYANPTEESEEELVAELVGNQGTIYLHWPEGLSEAVFDDDEWEMVDELPLLKKESSKQGDSKRVSVLDCISKYCQMEQLEDSDKWYCNKCKDFVPAFKQFHLYRTPPILIVHLKRFHFSSTTHRRDKIDTLIDFPLTGLNLTHEVMHSKEGEEPVYDCYAVSNHYGGLGGGHYTAYARSDDGVWCHFDDSRVTTDVSEEEVVSSAAYVLYYRRRDVDVGDFQPCDKISKESENMQSTELCSSVDAMDVEADVISRDSSRTCASHMDSIDGEDLYGDSESNCFLDDNDGEENPQSQ